MSPKSGKHPGADLGAIWRRKRSFLMDFERILVQFGVIFRDFQGSVTPKLLEIIVSGALGLFLNVFGTFQKERKMS